jgi:Ca-activated chloride channel family protein
MDHSAERHRRVIAVITDGDDNFSSLVKDLTVAEYRAGQRGEVTAAAAHERLLERRRRAVLEVQKAVQQIDAIFYAINPGGPSVKLNQISMRAQNDMESIAAYTGGSAFVPDGEQGLERVFNVIAAELRGQYLLQYYSNAQGGSAGFRRIAVTVPARNNVRVRARQGYYPKQK